MYAQTFPVDALHVLHAIIASLVVNRFKTFQLGDLKSLIAPSSLPLDMPVEKALLDIINAHELRKMPIFEEAVLAAVADINGGREYLNHIMTYRDVVQDVSQLQSLAFGLTRILSTSSLEAAYREMGEIVYNPRMNVAAKVQKMTDVLAEHSPKTSTIVTRTLSEGMAILESKIKNNYQKARAGLPIGATFPFPETRELVPILNKGEIVLGAMQSKHGKTLMADAWAHYIAHFQGYDVAVFHPETGIEQLMERIIARRLLYPTDSFLGYLNLDDPKHGDAFANLMLEFRALEETRGQISYVWCPFINASQFSLEISKLQAKSAARGRELVIFFDYFQQLGAGSNTKGDTFQRYSENADTLKALAEVHQLPIILFSQFDIKGDVDLESPSSFGGQKIIHRSQVVFAVKRTTATQDMKSSLVDALGNEIFYHRKDEFSSAAQLIVQRANNGRRGEHGINYINRYFAVNSPLGIKESRKLYENWFSQYGKQYGLKKTNWVF